MAQITIQDAQALVQLKRSLRQRGFEPPQGIISEHRHVTPSQENADWFRETAAKLPDYANHDRQMCEYFAKLLGPRPSYKIKP